MLSSLLLAAMLLSIATQVIARFVFGAPTAWAEELARYLLVSITMLGSAALLEKNEHITIDILVSILPMWLQTTLMWVRDAITLSVCGLLVHYGWLLVALGERQTSAGLGIKYSIPYMAIPIGALLMALVLVFSRASKFLQKV